MERCTFRTIKKKGDDGNQTATAWIKKFQLNMILFHKDEATGCTGTKGKSNEESLKEFAHPRVEVVIHEIADSIGHMIPGAKGMTQPAIMRSVLDGKPL